MIKLNKYIALILLILMSDCAFATSESLSVRRNSFGQIEVVLSGLTGFCNQQPVNSVDSVSVTGTTISINTIVYPVGGGCPSNTPSGLPYQVVALIGFLAPQTYTVVWTTSVSATEARSVFISSRLVVDQLNSAQSIPTLSPWAAITLFVLLLASGMYAQRSFRAEARIQKSDPMTEL